MQFRIAVDNATMDIFSIALQGMNRADFRLDKAAAKIAHAGAVASSDGLVHDTVDISGAMVSMLSAKDAFATNIKTFEVANETQKTVIDMLA
jgi:flagellar basal body rod protein FlgC